MAKGSYNISVSSDSNIEKDRKRNNENQECMSSCLNLAFQRSLSLHDRPRSSRLPSRYKALVSSSLEKIPSHPPPPSEGRSESSTNHGFASVETDAGTGMITQPSIFNASLAAHQDIDQNQLTESDSWLEDKYTRFSMESEKLLEKTVDILRTIDEDISESLISLIKPESLALESVMEIYRNKGRSNTDCSVGAGFNMSAESSSQPIYENWQPFIQQRPKDIQAHSTPQSPKNLQAPSVQQSPKKLQTLSVQQSPKKLQTLSVQQSPKKLQTLSVQQSPKNMQAPPVQQSPKNLQAPSVQQSPKNLMVRSSQETLENFESLLSLNSGYTYKLDSDHMRPVEQSPKIELSSPDISSRNGRTKVKSLVEFDLPSDHEQFIKIIGALQNRCLEYREMVQDIAVSALEVCLNFSEMSISRIRHLRRQFESQKRNFGDFKELCCKSVVFGPDSLPINEKVAEVIQSFYLKLLQEENETFMVRLEFGLKMGEVYAKTLKLETESKKIITTLEKEILYLKKTSVGFKV